MLDKLGALLPLLQQLKHYDKVSLRHDLAAGLTVGVMLIPQGMAYALIAGLPPIYGLYASLIPIVVYALFGTSRQLAVGPVAMISLLVAAGVAPLAEGDAQRYINLALLLSLMVGVIQLVLGLVRFGFLTNFLSHPVLAGFTSAAALIIGFSQLKHLLGVELPRSHHVHEILIGAVENLEFVHGRTLLIGLTSILLLVILRRWLSRVPGALAVVVIFTPLVWLLRLNEAGVAIVGEVPGGLPRPIIPDLGVESIRSLLPVALTIALVGFMESIAVAKVYATRHRYQVDSNRELVGLGMANIIGAFFRAYPATGGFSRTAVNDQSGARTMFAGLVSAAIIALTLLFLTRLFFYLPNAVLAAIVMVAVFKLIDWREALYLWRVDRKDLALMLLTFAATLGLGIEQGILVGVVSSLIVVVYQTSKPHTVVMGRLPGTDTFRNLERHPHALTTSGVVIFRMDASVFFANAGHFRERLRSFVERDNALRAVVLDFYPVNRIDSSGVHALQEAVKDLQQRKVRLYFSGVKGPVMDRLDKTEIPDIVGRERFFLEVHEAVERADLETESSAVDHDLQPA